MTSDEAVKQSLSGDNSEELDQAIDELRGVLKKDDEDTGQATPARRTSDKRPETTADAKTADNNAGKASSTDDMSSASSKAFPDFEDDGFHEELQGHPASAGSSRTVDQLDRIMDIPIDVQVVLGTTRMPVSALLNLSEGSTIALSRKIGEPVEITVNGRIIGRGEITVLEGEDNRFGVRLTDVIKASRS